MWSDISLLSNSKFRWKSLLRMIEMRFFCCSRCHSAVQLQWSSWLICSEQIDQLRHESIKRTIKNEIHWVYLRVQWNGNRIHYRCCRWILKATSITWTHLAFVSLIVCRILLVATLTNVKQIPTFASTHVTFQLIEFICYRNRFLPFYQWK